MPVTARDDSGVRCEIAHAQSLPERARRDK
jgi:hypothetical protein